MLKTSLRKIRENLHFRILLLRSIDVRINGKEFVKLWEESTEEQREEVYHIIEFEGMGTDPKEQLDKWVRTHPSRSIGEMPFKDLKVRAERLGIRNYSRLTRLELILAIEKREKK